jgi:hypothetical protein
MRATHIPVGKWWEAAAPIDRASMQRVFAAVGRPIAVQEADIEALHIAAAVLSKHIIQNISEPPPPPKARRRDVVRATVTLGRQLLAIQEEGYAAPPMLPPTWLSELRGWATANLRQRGRPRSDPNRIAIPRLLDLYALSFGVPPSHTKNGPTARFLTAWGNEVADAVSATVELRLAATRLPVLNTTNTLRLIQDWRSEGLRRRVVNQRGKRPPLEG